MPLIIFAPPHKPLYGAARGIVVGVRIAKEQALPFEPLVPNAETIAAMKESRKGGLPRFKSVEALLADLNAGD